MSALYVPVASIGNPDRVVDMLVGDTQRIAACAQVGSVVPHVVPPEVQRAFQRLVAQGSTTRLP